MFFSGLLSSLLGWFIFKSLEESPFFKEQQKKKAAGKIGDAMAGENAVFQRLSQYPVAQPTHDLRRRRGLLSDFGYLPSFLKVVNGVPNNASSLILMGASVAALVSAVLSVPSAILSAARRHSFWSASAWRCCCRSATSAWRRQQTPRLCALCAGDRLPRQCRLCADPGLPQRTISDRDPRQRHRVVLEYRLCSRRHDADIRVAGERRSGADPDVAFDLHRRHFRHLLTARC